MKNILRGKFYLDSVRLYFLYLFFFCLLYGTVLIKKYAFADDYTYLMASREFFSSLFFVNVKQGRIVNASILFIFHFFDSPSYFFLLRFFSIAGIAAVAMFFCNFLYKNTTLSFFSSLVTGGLIGLMPGFQVYAAWAVCMYYPWSALSAGLSFVICERKNISIKRYVLSILLLLFSMNIYQPTAMMFWVVLAIYFCFSKVSSPLRKVLILSSVGFVAMGLEYLLCKVISIFFYGPTLERLTLSSDVLFKIEWFLFKILRNALTFSYVERNLFVSIASLSVIVSGLGCFLFKSNNNGIIRLGSLFIFPFLTFLPSLFVSENMTAFRVMVSLEALLVVYFVFAVKGWGKVIKCKSILNLFFIGAFVISCFFAAYNVRKGFSVPESIELNLLQNFFVEHNYLKGAHRIYIIPAKVPDRKYEFSYYGEYGTLASATPWVIDMLVCSFTYQKNSLINTQIEHSSIGTEDHIPVGEEVTIIDFKKITQPVHDALKY